MYYFDHKHNQPPYDIKTYNAVQVGMVASLNGKTFRSLCGVSVEIQKIEPNTAGFYQAELIIDGNHVSGDVVFTQTLRHWYILECHLNSRFNTCVLHPIYVDDLFNLLTHLHNGKRIQTVVIPETRGVDTL